MIASLLTCTPSFCPLHHFIPRAAQFINTTDAATMGILLELHQKKPAACNARLRASASSMPSAPAGMIMYAMAADGRCFWRAISLALRAAGGSVLIGMDDLQVSLAVFFLQNFLEDEQFKAHFIDRYLPNVSTIDRLSDSFTPLLTNGTPLVLPGDGPTSRAVRYAFAPEASGAANLRRS